VVYKKPADVGMPAALANRLGELLALEKGLIVVSSPPASGLTTTFDVVVQTADRLVRDFVSIEDAVAPSREIQNVKPVRFDARTGVSPLDALAGALRDYPRAIVTRDLRDRALAVELARLAGDDQLVIVSMKASDAIDAVARLLACGVSPDQLARTLVGSVSQRLVRRLCPKCREDYPTPGEILARLKTTAENLPHLRKASQHGCRLCRGTGYLGRTAVFELASGSLFRQAIAAKADQKILRQAAVKDGMQPMRDAGMALVVEGVTSLEEMQRVFAVSATPRPEAVEARVK
jgi:type II secretory ATPase GspE/PulE/Tfp pilus assembly ATPase PilB-like protein